MLKASSSGRTQRSRLSPLRVETRSAATAAKRLNNKTTDMLTPILFLNNTLPMTSFTHNGPFVSSPRARWRCAASSAPRGPRLLITCNDHCMDGNNPQRRRAATVRTPFARAARSMTETEQQAARSQRLSESLSSLRSNKTSFAVVLWFLWNRGLPESVNHGFNH